MRPIDADAIADEQICQYLGSGFCDCAPDIRDLIDDQPTIEADPIIHAHWVYDKWTPIYCSHCGKELKDLFQGCILLKEPRRCPHCGARMDEEV